VFVSLLRVTVTIPSSSVALVWDCDWDNDDADLQIPLRSTS